MRSAFIYKQFQGVFFEMCERFWKLKILRCPLHPVRYKIFYLFFLIFGSCAHVPNSDLAHISNSISLDKSIELASDREFFEEGGWPTAQWWEMFGDPQLDHLIQIALKESPTIQKAIAKVAKAEQEARKERSSLFPKVNADYEEQWEYFSKNGFVRSFYPTSPTMPISPTVNQIDLTLHFDYEIDFFGRNRNLFKAALGNARAERAEARQATLILTTLIAQTYIELQTKLAQREILIDRLQQRNMLFDLTSFRDAYGLDSVIPVLEKEQSIYEVETTVFLLDKEIALDKHMLAILVGVGQRYRYCAWLYDGRV